MNRRRTTCPQLGQAIALGCGALLAGCGDGPSDRGFESAIFSEVRVIGSLGNGPGQFVKPRSVAGDRNDAFNDGVVEFLKRASDVWTGSSGSCQNNA